MIQKTYGTMYYVDDMKKSVAFYQAIVGFAPTYASDDWTEFSVGGHNLCLHSKRAGENYGPGGILILATDGIKSLAEKFKRDGLSVTNAHEVHPGSWTFHVKDQSGNETSYFGAP